MSQETTLTSVLEPIDSEQNDVAVEGTWDPQLIESLYDLLYGVNPGRELVSELELLEARHGGAVYSELIYLLSHLRFDHEEAREHWTKIIDHRDRMQVDETVRVDLRVALVSYFVEVNRQFTNPKVIELRVFEQTQASAYRDDLTGLHNYRLFREQLMREIRRADAGHLPLSLIMLDVDCFKGYNDRHGHEAGNEVLKQAAEVLRDSIRKMDVAARYGGEEFALILPDTFKTVAAQIAEETRRRIEDHAFPFGETQPGGSLTVSVGVATYPADACEPLQLVRAADRALYLAKSGGRNQVQLYGSDRRSFRRIDASLEGSYRIFDQEGSTLSTLNISEGGLLLLVNRPLETDNVVEASVTLPESSECVSIVGRVVTTKERGDGMFEVGIRTIEIGQSDREVLQDYLKVTETVD
ncbi:MAG: diguanylate cyclase [bacterium]|nr:diguanylate cyclase [bacterium]